MLITEGRSPEPWIFEEQKILGAGYCSECKSNERREPSRQASVVRLIMVCTAFDGALSRPVRARLAMLRGSGTGLLTALTVLAPLKSQQLSSPLSHSSYRPVRESIAVIVIHFAQLGIRTCFLLIFLNNWDELR